MSHLPSCNDHYESHKQGQSAGYPFSTSEKAASVPTNTVIDCQTTRMWRLMLVHVCLYISRRKLARWVSLSLGNLNSDW